MYIVPIAWLYVALMMAVVEATNTNGTILGAVITFLLYGLGPVLLVVYVLGAPSRRRAIKEKEAAELHGLSSTQPDAGSLTTTDAVTPVREKP